ncbi:MAG: hypothetical protein AAF555_05975 [Verrucomicrobiota bacterium]
MSRRTRKRRRKSGGARWWGLFGLLVLGLALGGFLGGYLWLQGYLRGDEFRRLLEREIGKPTRSKAQLSPLTWQGNSQISADELFLEGKEGAVFSRLRLKQVRAVMDLGAVREGFWKLDSLDTSLAELDFSPERLPQEARPSSASTKVASSPAWYQRFLPSEFVFERFSAERFRLVFPTADDLWLLEEGRLLLRPSPVAPRAQELSVVGGKVRGPGLRPWQLESAKLQLSPDSLLLLASSLRAYGGDWEMTGELEWGDPASLELFGDFKNLPVGEVIPEDWKQRLSGTLAGEFRLRRTLAADRLSSYRGQIELRDGVLTALPILDQIASYTRVEQFRRLTLDEASCRFVQQGRALRMDDIVLSHQGLFRLTGRLDVVDRNLTGLFRLGVTPGTLSNIPGAEAKVFTQEEGGYRWTDIAVSGTLEDPDQDLTPRLYAAAAQRMLEVVPETGLIVLRSTGRVVDEEVIERLGGRGAVVGLIDQGAGVLRDTGNTVLDGAGDLLEGGGEMLNQGSDLLRGLFERDRGE